MREFDHDGLLLCSIQSRLFEETLEKVDCSSEVFIRRYMNSKIVNTLDSTAFLDDNATTDNIIEEIVKEYGKSEYGNNKFEKDELHWIGYIYRYFAYTYELSSSYIYKLIKPGELRSVYYPYHTMDPKMAIERLLEARNIDLSVEGLNKRAYEIIKDVYAKSKVTLLKLSNNTNTLNESIVNYGNVLKRDIFNVTQNNKNLGTIELKFLDNNMVHLFVNIINNIPDKYYVIYNSLKEVFKKIDNKQIITYVMKKTYKIESFLDNGFIIESENDLNYKLIKE